jgi:hypothetical protein
MREGGEEAPALRCAGGEGETVHDGDGSVLKVGGDPQLGRSWAGVGQMTGPMREKTKGMIQARKSLPGRK